MQEEEYLNLVDTFLKTLSVSSREAIESNVISYIRRNNITITSDINGKAKTLYVLNGYSHGLRLQRKYEEYKKSDNDFDWNDIPFTADTNINVDIEEFILQLPTNNSTKYHGFLSRIPRKNIKSFLTKVDTSSVLSNDDKEKFNTYLLIHIINSLIEQKIILNEKKKIKISASSCGLGHDPSINITAEIPILQIRKTSLKERRLLYFQKALTLSKSKYTAKDKSKLYKAFSEIHGIIYSIDDRMVINSESLTKYSDDKLIFLPYSIHVSNNSYVIRASVYRNSILINKDVLLEKTFFVPEISIIDIKEVDNKISHSIIRKRVFNLEIYRKLSNNFLTFESDMWLDINVNNIFKKRISLLLSYSQVHKKAFYNHSNKIALKALNRALGRGDDSEYRYLCPEIEQDLISDKMLDEHIEYLTSNADYKIISRNRIQAITQFPVLIGNMIKIMGDNLNMRDNTYYFPFMKRILFAIDKGESLIDILKEAGYSTYTIKHVLTKTRQAFPRVQYTDFSYNSLFTISPHLLNIIFENNILNKKFIIRNSVIIAYEHILGPVNIKNPPTSKEMGQIIGLDFNSLYDFVRTLSSINSPAIQINGMTLAQGDPYNYKTKDYINCTPIGTHKLFHYNSLSDLIRASDEYHKNIGHYSTIFHQSIESAKAIENKDEKINWSEWPNYLGDYENKKGTIKFLLNSNELQQEGKKMSHCVGGFTSETTSGSSFIAHITTYEDESTVELRIRDSKIYIRQHHTYNNKIPSITNTELLNEFIKHIHKTKVINKEKISMIEDRKRLFKLQYSRSYKKETALLFAIPYIKNLMSRKYRKMDMNNLRKEIESLNLENLDQTEHNQVPALNANN